MPSVVILLSDGVSKLLQTDGVSKINLAGTPIVAFVLLANGSSRLLQTDGVSKINFASSVGPAGFAVLPIGAGGWITGIDIANDDTLVMRTDTYGAYRWNGTAWEQLLTTSSMTSGTDIGQDSHGDLILTNFGVYEISIAPTNSNRLYLMYNGLVYRSDDRGNSWTRTGFSAVTFNDGNGFNYRMNGQRMDIHPTDPDTCVVTTPSNGAFYTRNAGVSWTAISGITNPTSAGPGMMAQFDPANGNTVYIASDGVGVYRSTTGVSGTFTLTSSGPTTFQRLFHDKYGRLWAAARSGTHVTWLFSSGAWVNKNLGSQSGRIHSIVCSPSSSNNIWAAIDSGDIITSTNAGSTWANPNFNTTRSSGTGEPGWLSATNETYMSNGNMVITSTGRVIFAEGIGVWYTDSPGATTAWHSMSCGIEQLVVNRIVSPPNGSVITSVWDRNIFRLPSLSAYPAGHGINYSQPIMHGWSCDYAKSDPACIVVHATDNGGTGAGGKSTDGGLTWALFGTQPKSGNTYGGGIAAASNQNFVVIHGSSPTKPRFTTNGGTSWADSTVTGVTDGWQDVGNSLHRQIITCDFNGTFYAYNDGTNAGIYKSTDGGATFTRVFTGHLHGGSPGGIDSFNSQLEAVPGASYTGRLCFTAGDVGGSTAGTFLRSNDGGVTWAAVANVVEVKHFGFGKAKPGGGGHPAVYIVGWVSGTYGVWRCDDFEQATPTWTQIGAAFPIGRADIVTTVCGDINTYNSFYIGYRGSGAISGVF